MAVKFVVVFMLAALAVASAVPESLANPTASMTQRDPAQRRPYYGGQYTMPTNAEAERVQKQLQQTWNKVKSWFGDEGVTTATEFHEVLNDSPIGIWDMEDEGVTLSDSPKEKMSEIQKLLDKIKNKVKDMDKKGKSKGKGLYQ